MPEKILVLFENAEEVEHYFKQQWNWNRAEVVFASTSGAAILAVEQHGKTCLLPVNYTDPNRLFELERENYGVARQLFERLDALYHSQCVSKEGANHNLLEFISQHIFKNNALDQLFGRLIILRGLVEKVRPTQIAIFGDVPIFNSDQPGFFGEPLNSGVACLLGASLNIPVKHLQGPAGCPPTDPVQKISVRASLIQKLIGTEGYEILKDLRHNRKNLVRFFKERWPKKNRPKLLFTFPNKDGKLLVASRRFRADFDLVFWKQYSVPVHMWPPRIFPKVDPLIAETERLNREIQGLISQLDDPIITALLTQDGIDLTSIALPKLANVLKDMTLEGLSAYLQARQLLPLWEIDGVVTGPAARSRVRGIVQAARELDIPVFDIQHGGEYGYVLSSFTYFCDYAGTDHFAAWGEGVVEHFLEEKARHEKSSANIQPQARALGSGYLTQWAETYRQIRAESDTLRDQLGIEKDRRIALYAPCTMFGNQWFVGSFYTDEILHTARESIFAAMAKAPEWHYLMKTISLPGDDPMKKRIRQLRLPHMGIRNTGSFCHYLALADLLIVDFPGTMLLEALITDIPTVVYCDRDYLNVDPETIRLLSKRAIVAERQADLFDTVLHCLQQENLPRGTDTAFRDRYGKIGSGIETLADDYADFFTQTLYLKASQRLERTTDHPALPTVSPFRAQHGAS